MKNTFVSILLVFAIISNTVFADCDFATGITPGANGTYVYSKECHVKVGQLVKENEAQASAIQDYKSAITMKDLALQSSDKRATLWYDTSEKLEGRLQKVVELERGNNLLYFGLGALTILASGWMASKLMR